MRILGTLLLAAMGMGMATGTASGTTQPDRSIVIFGASYAKGWGVPALPGYAHVVNRGAGGEETGDMQKRFATDVVAAKPDVVLIWGLVNNITRSPPDRVEAAKSAAREHYVDLLKQARAAGITVVLATEVPWTEPSGILNGLRAWIGGLRGKQSYAARISAHVHEVNEFLRQLAKREALLLLDFEQVFAGEGGTRMPEYAAQDGSHISEEGYRVLTNYAVREFRRAERSRD